MTYGPCLMCVSPRTGISELYQAQGIDGLVCVKFRSKDLCCLLGCTPFETQYTLLLLMSDKDE